MSEIKTIALQGGDDCYDCACTHLDIPVTMDVEEEQKLWRAAGGYHKTGLFLEGWLKSRGAVDSQMECFDET